MRLIAVIFSRLHTILSPDADFHGYWTELSRGWHPHLTNMVEISQGKQQMKLLCILEQSLVTDFGITKLSFDNTKRMAMSQLIVENDLQNHTIAYQS